MKSIQTFRCARYYHLGLTLMLAYSTSAMAEPAPEVAVFGASVNQTTSSLESLCSKQTLRSIEPVEIPGVSKQVQLECEGFDYFGAKRKAEFIFGDDALTILWILIDASETDDLTTAFRETFGQPSHDTSDFTAFADHQAAVRRDVPEALYYAPVVADAYRGWFDQKASSD